jgi:hypothetical protein
METTDSFREIVSSLIRSGANPPTTPAVHPVTTPFTQHAIQLRNRLSSIEGFISRISQSYLLVKPVLWTDIPSISDNERSVIDDNLERQLHEASRWLEQLKDDVKKSYRQSNPSANGVREHNQNIVIALLARLSEISKRVGRLQTAHYEAVLTSQSPFAVWVSLPKQHGEFQHVYNSSAMLSSTAATSAPSFKQDGRSRGSLLPMTLVHALSSTMSPSDALSRTDKVRSKGASTMEQWAYAVLLASAHKQLKCVGKDTSEVCPLQYFGSAAERVLRQEEEFVWREEWERVLATSLHCWHWKELYEHLGRASNQVSVCFVA